MGLHIVTVSGPLRTRHVTASSPYQDVWQVACGPYRHVTESSPYQDAWQPLPQVACGDMVDRE